METRPYASAPGWKRTAYSIIFESDTPEGRAFDIALLVAIVLSVVAVMLESVHAINAQYGHYLRAVEWFFTGLFALEYMARLVVVRRPLAGVFASDFDPEVTVTFAVAGGRATGFTLREIGRTTAARRTR